MVAPDPRSSSPTHARTAAPAGRRPRAAAGHATRLVSLLSQTEWMIRDVEEAVRLDLALTARVLRFANSAWTAHLPSVSTIRDALMRIGVGTTLSLAIAEGVRPRLLRPLPAFDLQPGRLWQHAVASALATEIVTKRARIADSTRDRHRLAAARRRQGGPGRSDGRRDADGAAHRLDERRAVAHRGRTPGARHGPRRTRRLHRPPLGPARTRRGRDHAPPHAVGDPEHHLRRRPPLERHREAGRLRPAHRRNRRPDRRRRAGAPAFSPADLHTFCSELTERMRTGQERFH